MYPAWLSFPSSTAAERRSHCEGFLASDVESNPKALLLLLDSILAGQGFSGESLQLEMGWKWAGNGLDHLRRCCQEVTRALFTPSTRGHSLRCSSGRLGELDIHQPFL